MAVFRTTLRDRAMAVLQPLAADEASALAGAMIQANRATGVPSDSLPFIAVYTTATRRQLASPAGGAPEYDTTTTLLVLARASDPVLAACAAQLDALTDEIEDALLSSVAFMAAPLREVTQTSLAMQFGGESDTILGEAALTLECRYFEAFDPVVTDALETLAVTVRPEDRSLPLPTDDPELLLTIDVSEPPAALPIETEAGGDLLTESDATITEEG